MNFKVELPNLEFQVWRSKLACQNRLQKSEINDAAFVLNAAADDIKATLVKFE